MEIERVEVPAATDIEFLHDRIYEFNVEATGLDDGRLLTFLVRDSGAIVAGLHGWTWGSSYHVIGFLDDHPRGHGQYTMRKSLTPTAR